MKIITLIACCFLFSCTNDKKEKFVPKELKINFSGQRQVMKFNQYFDSARAISLETTPKSLIGKISRIVYNKEKIYLLDVITNSVFIFNSTGKFLNKIHSIGTGPGKFIGLRDFSLDEENKRLILHSHRPYKLIYYSLDGAFLSEELLDDYYHNIGLENNKLITINTSLDKDYLVNVSDLRFNAVEEFIQKSNKSKIFESFTSMYPNILKSKRTYITFPYSPIIYTFDNGAIRPIYKLNFGKYTMPDSLFSKKHTAAELYNLGMENNYGFFISNFRETDAYFVFTFGKNNMVIYSKKDGTSSSFNFVRNDTDLINFENCFGHDGNDNYMFSINEANAFKAQMAAYREDPKWWVKVKDYLKDIDAKLNSNNNPVLIMYKLKSN